MLRGRRPRDLVLRGPEYGPADGAAVELSDSFALAFSDRGFLRASRTHAATDADADDARAFVRHLARRRAIADDRESASATPRLVRARKSHAVFIEEDGVRRLRRIWIAKERPVKHLRPRLTFALALTAVMACRCASAPAGSPPPAAEPITPADLVASIADVAAGKQCGARRNRARAEAHRVPAGRRHDRRHGGGRIEILVLEGEASRGAESAFLQELTLEIPETAGRTGRRARSCRECASSSRRR